MPRYSLVPVEHEPTFTHSLLPVDHDPFEAASGRVRGSVRPVAGRKEGLLTQATETAVPRIAEDLYSLPQRAIEGSAADLRNFGDHSVPMRSVGPATEAAMWMMGVGAPMAERGAVGATGGRLGTSAEKRLSVRDDGLSYHVEPADMEIPEYGRGLTWGLTANRTTPNGGVLKDTPIMKIRDARLPEGHPRGFGTPMYQNAIEAAHKEGRAFASDSVMTSDAIRVWQALKSRGYDVQTSPGVKYRAGPPEAPKLSSYYSESGDPIFYIHAPPGAKAR